MSKTLKMSILLVIITLGFLFLGTEVKAVEVNSEDSLLQALDIYTDPDRVVDTNITLTTDIESNAIVDFDEYDWVLDLNGHTLTVSECYVNSGSLTINDSKGNGELITTSPWFWVEDGAKLTINSGKINYLVNGGTTIINNGTIENLTNDANITINDGKFSYFWQRGTNATIKGGTFGSSTIALDNGTTTILGCIEFNRTQEEETALTILSGNPIDSTVIEQLVGKGYVATFSGSGSNSYEDELYESGRCYEVTYEPVKVIEDETEEILNKIAPNGVWKINGAKPVDWEESDFLLTAIAGDVELPKGYEVYAFCESEDPFNPENVTLCIDYNYSTIKRVNIKAFYNEPEKEVKDKVGSILDKIAEKTGESHKVETGFRLEDLYLINYLNVAKDGVNSSLALNFSKDLIALTNGGNVAYKFDSRLGDSTPTGLWNYTGGRVIVYYDGVGVGTTEIGLTLSNVLYVPSDTAENKKIDAALARIKDYLGTTDGITITKGGTLDSLNADGLTWKDYGFIDENTSGSNYYNVTIKGETYKFAICKKDSDKLETPKYVGTDVISKISVTSDDKTIPLDTAVTVKKVESNEIKKALGTDAYVAYDITLYSNAKESKIKELKNEMFKVSIPVPENLKNIENLTVYYIDDNGNKNDYNGTVDDETGMATFETNHFSTYAIAEKEEKVEIYSLTLDANEGKFSDGKAKIKFDDVTKCDMTKVEKPIKDGYTFKGWFTEKTGGISIETVMSSEDGIKEDTTFYAQWEKIETNNKDQENTNIGNISTGTGTGSSDRGNDKPIGSNPDTGDNILVFAIISLISVVGIIGTIKIKKYIK